MSDIDAKIATIKARRDAAQLTKARAQATRESALATYNAAMARLFEDFGVDSLTAARDKLTELQATVQTELDEMTKELDEIEL